MKKYIIFIAAAALWSLSSCIEETFPTEHVLDSQIEASESALEGMVNSIYTTMAGYKDVVGNIEMISYGSMRAQMEHSTTPLVCSGNNGYNTMGAWHYGSISSLGTNRGVYPSYVYYAYIRTVNDIINMLDVNDLDNAKIVHLGICYTNRALY
mgnify:FL=1